MSYSDVVKSLRMLDSLLRGVLTSDSHEVLQDAVRKVEESHRRFKGSRRWTHHQGAGQSNWGFDISPSRPLRFIRADHIAGFQPEVDLYGTMRWASDHDHPDDACVVLRVWSSSEAYFYREGWDAECFCDMMTDPANASAKLCRRVLLRLHFDRRKRDAQHTEPLYHLHIGGQGEDNELCWFPSGIVNPRIPFVPVDLVLACEIVISDLFPHKYADLARDPEWKHLLHQSQATLMVPYLEGCLHALEQKQSWLGHLRCAEY